jgi:hypothetical protein
MDHEESQYSKIESPPQFKSAIPDHLLAHLCPKEKFVIEQLSLSDQKLSYLITSTARIITEQSSFNRRLVRVERFTGKWALIGAGLAILATILLSEGARAIFGKIFP